MQQRDMAQIKDIAQIIDNSSVSPKVKEAIRLIISEVLGEANNVHIKTQEIGDEFLADCRNRKLSPKTLSGYIPHIKKLVELSEEFPPQPKVIHQALLDCRGTFNADSHYRTWHALGGYAQREYGISNFMDKVIRPGVPKQIMPTISDTELEQLAVIVNSATPRDKAIICLLIDTAVRLGEAVNLQRQDILEDRIMVHGKTGYRVAPISKDTRDLLLSLPATTDGFVFHGRAGKPLGKTGFYKVAKKYLLLAGYTKKHPSPQTLRRSFGRFWLRSGGDRKSLSMILGHASVVTTDLAYTPLLEEDLIEIHQRKSPGRAFGQVNEVRQGVKTYP